MPEYANNQSSKNDNMVKVLRNTPKFYISAYKQKHCPCIRTALLFIKFSKKFTFQILS